MPSMIGNLQGKLYLAVAINIYARGLFDLIQELLHRLVLQLPSFLCQAALFCPKFDRTQQSIVLVCLLGFQLLHNTQYQ